MPITRREFCTATGTLLVGVSLAGIPATTMAQQRNLSPSLRKNPRLSTWLRINPDGIVTVFPGKCELGQGIGTALAQIVADELDVSIERLKIETVDTDFSPDEAYTFGSLSIQHSGSALRQAAAEMRRILVQNAARQLDVATDRLSVRDGSFLVDGSPSGRSYADALAQVDFDAEIRGDVEPKAIESYSNVGHPVERLDLPGKVFAEPAYIQDVRFPGMLHARIVRPPHQSQRLESVEEEQATSIDGVKAVVRDGSFLAVVAVREEQAMAAAEALRTSAKWTPVKTESQQYHGHRSLRRSNTDDSVIHRTTTGSREAVTELTADYSRPFIAHASMSPAAAIAKLEDDRLTVWCHGQGMYPLRGAIAKVVELPEDKVHLVHREASGCYGHNGADDAACDAAVIAIRMPGDVIRLQWSRQDEFRYEPLGSAMSIRVSAGLDEHHRLTHWQYDVWSATHSSRPGGEEGAGNLRAAREKSSPWQQPAPRNLGQPTGGGDRNALPLYAFPNQLISKHLVLDSPRFVSALRALGAYANVFAIESFFDELALAAGKDPLDMRLEYLDDKRAKAVLESLRDVFEAEPEQRDGYWSSRGIGFARYKNLGAYAGVVCEVHVNKDTGAVTVPRAFAAVDAGLVINPDGLSNQIEGGIVQSTSWTLKEAVQLGDASAQSEDWSGYPILRFTEAPYVTVNIIDSVEPSLGAGEAVQGPAAGAIGNAVAAACGARLRHLPLLPDRVLEAIPEDLRT